MFIHSVALILAAMASAFATTRDDHVAQDSVEEPSDAILKSGTVDCGVQGSQFLYQHDGDMSQFVKLTYDVRCSGNWSVLQRTSGRDEQKCSIVSYGAKETCSLTLAPGDQIHLQVAGGSGAGNGVSWTLE